MDCLRKRETCRSAAPRACHLVPALGLYNLQITNALGSLRRRERGSSGRAGGGIAPARLLGRSRGPKEEAMNKETVKGQWKQLKGQVRKQWGKLTDDDLDQIHGDAEILAGKIQERYGRAKDEAQREVERFFQDHPQA